jgi:hypothetical protein
VITTQTLRQMVINVAKGIGGTQHGARPAPVDRVDLDDVQRGAEVWINAFFETFNVKVLDRETSIAGSPAVLAAVGRSATAC